MASQSITGRDRYLNAIAGRANDRAPVWLMRQAGRYLPEYRELKSRHTFLELASKPELAAEVTLQPLRRFPLDAAILFSDIMFPIPSLGFQLDFCPGPTIANPIKTAQDIEALRYEPQAARKLFDSVCAAISIIQQNLSSDPNRPALIGFAGSPWTLACYLIDQRQYKHFHGTQVFAKLHPAAMDRFLTLLSDLVADYLLAQIDTGVDAVQLFDTWGGNLGLDDYRALSLPYIQRIIQKIRASGCPIALYTNGTNHLLPAIREAGADIVGVDWRTSLLTAREILPEGTAIQGNFDPTDLFLDAPRIEEKVRSMLSVMSNSRYIANLGHGVLPETPIESVSAFVEAVRSSAAYWSDVSGKRANS